MCHSANKIMIHFSRRKIGLKSLLFTTQFPNAHHFYSVFAKANTQFLIQNTHDLKVVAIVTHLNRYGTFFIWQP